MGATLCYYITVKIPDIHKNARIENLTRGVGFPLPFRGGGRERRPRGRRGALREEGPRSGPSFCGRAGIFVPRPLSLDIMDGAERPSAERKCGEERERSASGRAAPQKPEGWRFLLRFWAVEPGTAEDFSGRVSFMAFPVVCVGAPASCIGGNIV